MKNVTVGIVLVAGRLMASLGLAVGLVLASGVHADTLAAKEYPIKDVSKVTVYGGGSIEIIQGTTESLKVEGPSEVLPKLKVDLTGSHLTMGVRGQNSFSFSWFGVKNDVERVRYVLTVTDLQLLELNEAVRGHSSGIVAKTLSIKQSGVANFDVDSLSAETLAFDLSGAANSHVLKLDAKALNVQLSGASNLDVKSSSQADQAKVDASGASNLKGKMLRVKTATVGASGASNVTIEVSERLDANASGASNISYAGSPLTKQDSSGASHIKNI